MDHEPDLAPTQEDPYLAILDRRQRDAEEERRKAREELIAYRRKAAESQARIATQRQKAADAASAKVRRSL